MITREQIFAINHYFFTTKGMNREQLEGMLDFDNLTMDSIYENEILTMLKSDKELEALQEDEEDGSVIRSYVRFIKRRKGSGNITWDELVEKLRDLYLEESEFGIRAQRFGKHSYWEVFFNHYDITDYGNGDAKLTLDQEYYEEIELDNAYYVLHKFDIDTDLDDSEILTQIANKVDSVSDEDKNTLLSAMGTIYETHYVEKSKLLISKNEIENISMTNADLHPDMGLRDYFIKFTCGDAISLRF